MAQAMTQKQGPRWQDMRAKAIDATFDADRRRAGERVALVFRWIFLIVIGKLNNFNPNSTVEAKVIIGVVLFGWAVLNVTVQRVLQHGYLPGFCCRPPRMVVGVVFAA